MKKILILVAVLLLLIAGSAWALLHRRGGPDPKLLAVQQKVQASMSNLDANPEKLMQQWNEVGKEMGALPPNQRRQVMQAAFSQQIKEYLALSASEKVAYLDKRIQSEEAMRTFFGLFRRQNSDGGPGGANSGGAGAGGTGGGDPAANGNSSSDGNGQSQQRRNWRNVTPDQRLQFQKSMLQNTTPEQRAGMQAFISDMNFRRAQQGLQPSMFGR